MANNTQNTATDKAKILNGKGNSFIEKGAIGNNATVTTKAIDLTGAKDVGSVTVGETGLGAQALDAFKSLFQSQQSTSQGLLAALTPPPVASVPPATDSASTATAGQTKTKGKIIVGVVILLALGWWFFFKRKS